MLSPITILPVRYRIRDTVEQEQSRAGKARRAAMAGVAPHRVARRHA
jgi:hypothetical protein